MTVSTGRDYRIDFVRGIALIMIFINHIPGNVLGQFTNRNFGFSDSAEAFVILAGFAAAAAYYPRFAGGYSVATSVRVVRRAGLLYTSHILSTMLALALVCGAALLLAEPEYVRKLNIYPIVKDPVASLVGLALLTHQLAYFNILPLYIVILLLLPGIMAVYRLDWRLLLAVSGGLYIAVGLYVVNLPSYPGEKTWFFNPLAWQFLFVLGFLWGVRIRSGRDLPYNQMILWVAVGYVIFALVWVKWPMWSYFPKSEAFGMLWGFSKTYLSPFRLLHVLALAYVIGMSPLAGWMARIRVTNPIVQMGQHALPIFCVGSILSVLLWLVRDHLGGGALIDICSVVFGVLVQMALAWFLTWQSQSPAGQIGSAAAGGFMAGPREIVPPPVPEIKAI